MPASEKVISFITVPGSWERRNNPRLLQDQSNLPDPQPGQIVYVTKGRFLAWGGSAVLEQLPSGDVIKTPKPHPHFYEDYCQNMRLEARIYQAIGEHPRVPKIIKWDPETCCLTMEYMDHGNLKEYIRQNSQDLTPELRLRWARQAAEGVAVLHSIGAIHCDISPRNFYWISV
jgi:serine/threonine protein kinase